MNIYTLVIQFYTDILNIPLKETMSQISYLGPGFYFMTKTGYFCSFFKTLFLFFL